METSHGGGEDGDVGSMLALSTPSFLKIAHSVNMGEKIFAWRMLSRHGFVPLLVEKEDWSLRFEMV